MNGKFNGQKKNHLVIKIFFPLLFVLAIIYPLIFSSTFLQHVMIMVFLYAIISGGWNIISGYCGQVSLGHVAFFGISVIY